MTDIQSVLRLMVACIVFAMLGIVFTSEANATGVQSLPRFSNVYGDSAWLRSDTIYVGVRGGLGVHGKTWVDTLASVMIDCRTSGTPLAAIVPGRTDVRPAEAVIESLYSLPRTPMSAGFMHGTVYGGFSEPGYLGAINAPSMFGWQFACNARDTSAARVILFVVGRPDSPGNTEHVPVRRAEPRGSRGAPLPIRSSPFVRCYDLTPQECLQTYRIIGELSVDFGARRLLLLRQ